MGSENYEGLKPERPQYPDVVDSVKKTWTEVTNGDVDGYTKSEIAEEVAKRLNADPGHKWLINHYGLEESVSAESVITMMENFSN